MTTIVDIYCDAACDNNSKLKYMGIGVAVFIYNVCVPAAYRRDLSKCKMIGTGGTNNIAEWAALQYALETAVQLIASPELAGREVSLRIYSDSQLVVFQYAGTYEIKKQEFLAYKTECDKLAGHLSGILRGVHWVPRRDNIHADSLSKKAIIDFVEGS